MRRWRDGLFTAAVGLSTATAAAALAAIGIAIAARGLPAIDLEFLTRETRESGAAGGIFYQLVGTGLLVGTAAGVAMPLALGVALMSTEYVRRPGLRRAFALGLYSLNAVPSILYGLAGFHLLVHGLGWGKSWLAGGLVLGTMIFPTLAVSTREAIESVPRARREAALGLGLNRPKVIWAVVLPYGVRGLVTGTLIGLARAAGETAPILFTAAVFSGARWPTGIVDSPVLALPYHVLNLAENAYLPAARTQAWGTALVLVAIAFGLSAAALPLRLRLHAESDR